MGKARKPRLDRFTEREYQPYVAAIGQLALAWNDLHERLADLFMHGMGGGLLERWIKIWYSVNFDRPRRALLHAVITTESDLVGELPPQVIKEVKWILEIAEKLEDARNNAIHSPLVAKPDSVLARYSLMPGPVNPNVMLSNPRALKLAQKDLLTEFRWCRDCALTLRDFASQIDHAWGNAHVPWPRRPSLPNRGNRKRRRKARPEAHPK